jgi:hypothetical protein
MMFVLLIEGQLCGSLKGDWHSQPHTRSPAFS